MKTDYKEIETLVVPSDLDHLKSVEDLVDDVCKTNKVHEDHFGNILIAVTEAVNNAVQHGNNNDSSKRVRVTVAQNEKELKFCVSDEGSGFDFTNLPDPTAPENIEKEHGRGIFLMKSLADDVCFLNNGSTVEIMFSVSS